MTKRPSGSGSIYRLPSGNWRALVTIDQKRISHTAKTQKEAAAWLKQTTGQVEQGLNLAGAKTRFDQVLDSWLAIKENTLRGSSREQYERLTRLYIKPHLGRVLAKDLNAAKIQDFYRALQTQGVGARTIEIIHTVLHGVLKYAQRLGLVAQNWANLVEAPRPEKREMSVWNETQVNQFLTFLSDAPDQVFFRLAFATGMRRGELIGLQWEDLDWITGALIVRRQVYEPAGGGWRFQEPKTARGKRSIRLGAGMVAALRTQYNDILPMMRGFASDNKWQENGLIFPSRVGTPRNGYEVSKRFAELVKSAGLPKIRFHDIRHTAASIMLLHGEPPVRVAAILGQSVAVLLDTYAHYIPDDQASASALMDAITTPIPVEIDRARIAHASRTEYKYCK